MNNQKQRKEFTMDMIYQIKVEVANTEAFINLNDEWEFNTEIDTYYTPSQNFGDAKKLFNILTHTSTKGSIISMININTGVIEYSETIF